MATKVYLIDSNEAEYTAEELSAVMKEMFLTGVFNSGAANDDLEVTENSPAGMSVLVKAGAALVSYTKNGVTWKVIAKSNAVTTLAITNNVSGSNRVDAIVLKLAQTTPNALKNNVATIAVVLGSGVSALSDGAITSSIGDSNWIRLADVTVANGASSIVNANITDVRVTVGIGINTGGYVSRLRGDAVSNPVAADIDMAGFDINSAGVITGSQLIGATTPTTGDEATSKTYVDAAVGGIGSDFGDGSDGVVTISSPTTLTRDMYYSNLTLTGANDINTAGFKVFVSGVLTRNSGSTSKFTNNGGNGGNGNLSTQGAAGTAPGGATLPLPAAAVAGAGGAGVNQDGTAGTVGNSITFGVSSSNAVAGGAGGAADPSGHIGGAGGGAGTVTTPVVPRNKETAFNLIVVNGTTVAVIRTAPSGGSGGGGAGGNASAGSNSGGGGGGSGAPGGVVFVSAKSIVDSGTGTMFQSKGGTGGNGGNGFVSGTGNQGGGGGGGGAGGNGGLIIVAYKTLTGSAPTDVAGGAGGTGGTGAAFGTGTGANGGAGTTGNAGLALMLQL